MTELNGIDDLMQASLDTVERDSMGGLGKLTEMAEEMNDLEAEVAAFQDQIKERKKRIDALAMDDIPSLMDEVGGGIEGVTLKNGHKLTLRAFHSGKIPDDKKAEAIAWLDEHKFSDLIKTAVAINFGMHEFEKAEALAEQLQKEGMNVSADQSVHTGTLGKWIKEMAAEGKFGEIPEELFTPKTFRKAVIK